MIESLGIQLYTVRNEMTDEVSVREGFKKIKAIGYDHIQPASLCGLSAEKFASLMNEAGLTASKCGTLCGWSQVLNDPDKLIEENKIIGSNNICIGYMPPEWRDCGESVTRFIEKTNEFAKYAESKGITVGYHNHSFEFRKIDGVRLMDRLVNELSENVNFVLDTYWVQHGGGDVCAWIKKLSGRIEILHLKDMTMEDTQIFCEVGNGNINFEGVMEAADKAGIKSFAVEQDTCKGDPFDSIKMSYDYITKNFI